MPISEVFNVNCLEFMKTIHNKFFQLVCADPPYGIDWMNQIQNPNIKANWNVFDNKQWDKQKPNNDFFKELFRVSINQIIWGGNYFTDNTFPSPCWVIWDKMQEFNGAVFEMAWTSFESPAKAFRMSRVEAYTNQEKIHPTQKPVDLYKWLLKNYAKEGDKIFDPMMGSQSSRIAAYDMGFDFYGCELDADYFRDGCKRFEQYKAQLKLF